MTMLTKIGNSQGIRIPKPIIKQAHLENSELEFEVLEDGLLIRPIKTHSRQGWEENITQLLSTNKQDEAFIEEMLDDSDLEDLKW